MVSDDIRKFNDSMLSAATDPDFKVSVNRHVPDVEQPTFRPRAGTPVTDSFRKMMKDPDKAKAFADMGNALAGGLRAASGKEFTVTSEKILLDKQYCGFESLQDLQRDVEESFNDQIDPEFTGRPLFC